MTIRQEHIVFVLPGYKKCPIIEFYNYGICQVNQAEALASLGYQTTVITRFGENHIAEKNGVNYIFLNDSKQPVLKRWESSNQLIQKIREVDADIIHFHGFIFPNLLTKICNAVSDKTKVVAEYHSDPIFRILHKKQGHPLRKVDRLLFANEGAANLWQKKFNWSADHWKLSVECAPSSKLMPRKEARAKSGFHGSPIFLWNSRVIPRRDPTTVIDAYERFMKTEQFPDSHFYWMIPDGKKDLINELRDRVTQSKTLANSVTLLEERKPHHELASYFNSADYIISGSTDDGYGYGVADAMSCGVIPIVTDISTFNQITNQGEYGFLWKAGDANSLLKVMTKTVEETYGHVVKESSRIADYFEQSLSAFAQASKLDNIYQELFDPLNSKAP